jgi:hypothetical protein
MKKKKQMEKVRKQESDKENGEWERGRRRQEKRREVGI